MTHEEIRDALSLLSKAIERVTVNTYVEQGALAADEVFEILGRVEKILNAPEEKKKPTNFDRIKAMSVEELARFLCNNGRCSICPGFHVCNLGGGTANGLIKYLESEVD